MIIAHHDFESASFLLRWRENRWESRVDYWRWAIVLQEKSPTHFYSAALLSYLIGKGRGLSVNNVNPFYPRMCGWNWASSCMPGYTYIQKNVFNSDQRILTISFKTDTTLHFNNLESSLLKILVQLALWFWRRWKSENFRAIQANG